MGKVYDILLAIAVVILSVTGALYCAEVTEDNVYKYDEELGGYILTELNTVSIDVTIPSEYNDKPVVGIGSNVLKNAPGIYKVTLPDSIITIGEDAFRDTLLTTINLPEGLQSIGNSAFNGTKLKNVTIPSTCRIIGDFSFNYVKLKSFEIKGGDTPLAMGKWVFQKTKLAEIYLPSRLYSVGDYCFSADSPGLVINCEGDEGSFETGIYWALCNYDTGEYADVNYNVPREEN